MNRTELSHGRGWMDAPAAASVHRIDRQLGRLADINEAGRSAAQADANYAAWMRYLNGGPKAPYALPARLSVHCQGMAADSDDWYNAAAAAVWRANGWRQTARYPNDPKKDEPWHGEYFAALDQHRNATASSGVSTTPQRQENPDVKYILMVTYDPRNGALRRYLIDPEKEAHREISDTKYQVYKNVGYPLVAGNQVPDMIGEWPKTF